MALHLVHLIALRMFGCIKPAPEPYLSVARAFDADISDVRLVAAYSGDVSGALAAGRKAAFVAGPGMVRPA
jgi:2-haloacid dehalogenase